MLPIHHVQVKKAKRVLAQAFVELPSKDEYPDYYELIKKPMDLRMILERIDEQQYRRWENFERDMLTLFENAKAYNEEGSPIYVDAMALEAVFRAQPRNASDQRAQDAQRVQKLYEAPETSNGDYKRRRSSSGRGDGPSGEPAMAPPAKKTAPTKVRADRSLPLIRWYILQVRRTPYLKSTEAIQG